MSSTEFGHAILREVPVGLGTDTGARHATRTPTAPPLKIQNA